MSRPPDFSTRPGPPRAPAWQTWALALAALLLAWSTVAATQASRAGWADAARLAGLRREVEGLRARASSLETRQRGAAGETLTAQLVLTAEAGPERVLAELSDLLPADVRLERVSFAYGARLGIEAQVVARRPPAYDVFLERLAGSPLFADVAPGAEARENEMRSSLSMSYRRLP